jgi:xylulokinase
MTYLIGTDIGTLGTKSILVTIEGEITASAFEEYDVITLKPSWAEQRPEIWFDAVCKTIKSVLDTSKVESKDVEGVCISSLYGGSGIFCDKNMSPLRPCLIWADRRATSECEWVKEKIGEEEIFKTTGNVIDPYYGYTKMLYIKSKEPNIWNETKYIVTPNAYCIYRLTDSLSIDLSSAGNYGGIFNIHKRDWSEELMDELGISRSFFPENLLTSKDLVGEVTENGANLTGLQKGTPVMAGGIDAPVSALSSGAIYDGDLSCMLGTSMCNGFISDKLRLSPKLVNFPYVVRDKEMLYSFAGIVTAGYCIRWFRDQLGKQESEMADQLDLSSYAILDLEAQNILPGSEGLLFLPHLMVGERAPYWDDYVRGTLAGLTVYHTKAHIFRAFLEGISYAVKYSIEVALESGMRLNRSLLVNGGAKSALWRAIMADVTGRPMGYIAGAAGAPLGDALLAGVGCGALKDYTAIKDWVKITDNVEPNPKNRAVYDKYYKIFRRLDESIREVYRDF